METIRTIESICKEKGICFQTTLLGRNYCSLAFHRKVECEYLGEITKDGLFPCTLQREEEFRKN